MQSLNLTSQALWLALLKTPRLGINQFNYLSSVLPDPLLIFRMKPAELTYYKLSEQQQAFIATINWDDYQKEVDWLTQQNIEVLPISSPHYPSLLKETARPPLLLFAKGDLSVLEQVQVAVVGSRNPSPYGERATALFSEQLAQAGVVVTSGMAIGVDGIAHQACLRAGGRTLAVMGSGFRHIYPKRHLSLFDQITNQGLVVSEFFPDVPPIQYNFPRRNRIIAGLSNGTLVVEAAIKSGSLITAKIALEEGRDVFAVPGNIFNPMSEGAHHLLQQGAKLVCQTDDILEEYSVITTPPPTRRKNNLAAHQLLASVDHDTTPVDVIVQRSKLPVEQVLTELLDLEVQGLVAAVLGGYMRID
ncbi:MAG: DNA-protecting protein DprA [Gammaproteobacteria bacterium]|nr:DNA-protecting protein DprA [Gammaproteobacteria bacterium]